MAKDGFVHFRCGTHHNHDLAYTLEDHSYVFRLNEEERNFLMT